MKMHLEISASKIQKDMEFSLIKIRNILDLCTYIYIYIPIYMNIRIYRYYVHSSWHLPILTLSFPINSFFIFSLLVTASKACRTPTLSSRPWSQSLDRWGVEGTLQAMDDKMSRS